MTPITTPKAPKHERLIMEFCKDHGIPKDAAYALLDGIEHCLKWHTSRAESRGMNHGLRLAKRGRTRPIFTAST